MTFLSIDPNNVNIDKSSTRNVIAIDSAIKNKRMKKSNKDIKVGLKVLSNIATAILVFY